MPDIYDPERGLKIGLTDEDYENYQNGNLSDDFYARRTDGSIANRVTISPLDDDNDEDGEPSGGIDPGSAVIGALIMATIAGATYGIKKLWDRHKAKKAETQVNVRKEEGTQLSTETACEVLSTETAKSNDAEPKSLTQEEAIQASVYKGYKRDKIEMRGDRAEISDFPLYLNTVAGGLDRRDQTIGGFFFVVKIYALPVVEIIGQLLYLLGRYGFNAQFGDCL